MFQKLNTVAVRFLDTSYVLKFLLRLLAFYILFRVVNWLMIGAIVPGGFYSSFVDHYLNYVTWVKISILQTAGWMAGLFGVDSYLSGNSHLQLVGSRRIFMAWSCCGLEIMSFWAAFALADTTDLRKKLLWCFGGLAFIWLINCMRVALLAVAVKNNWPQIGTIRHHDSFNLVAYGFVLLMMLYYYQKNKAQMGR